MITGSYCEASSETVKHSHFHADYEMLYIARGWVEIEIGQCQYRAQAPSIIFIGNLETHRIAQNSPDYARYVVTASQESLKGIPLELLSVFRSRPAGFEHVLALSENEKEAESIFARIVTECEQNDRFSEKCACHAIHLLLTSLFRSAPLAFPTARFSIPEVLTEMQSHLDEHFSENLSIADVAAQFYLSPATVRRLFQQFVGCSPKHYVLLNRLSYARNLLENESVSVTEAARASGFADVSYFIRCFKAQYGLTPKTLRSKE